MIGRSIALFAAAASAEIAGAYLIWSGLREDRGIPAILGTPPSAQRGRVDCESTVVEPGMPRKAIAGSLFAACEPHLPLDVVMTIGRSRHDLSQHPRRKVAHELHQIPLLAPGSTRHAGILASGHKGRTLIRRPHGAPQTG